MLEQIVGLSVRILMVTAILLSATGLVFLAIEILHGAIWVLF